jgi:hypothetical protein
MRSLGLGNRFRSVGAVRASGLLGALVALILVGGVLTQPAPSALAQEATTDIRYRNGYPEFNARHTDYMGLIDGVPHIVASGGGSLGEIRIYQATSDSLLLRATITNPAFSDWGHMLTVVPDANGDGVMDIATFAGQGVFFMLSGNHPFGTVLNGFDAAIYYDDFGDPRHAVAVPGESEFMFGSGDSFTRRATATGAVLQTISGIDPNGAAWVGDYDGDAVPDFLAGTDMMYLIPGSPYSSGAASDLAIRTFSDPETNGLGYAEDHNNIMTAIGDIDGDGVNEIAIGTRLHIVDLFGLNYGRVVVFDGATAEVLYRLDPDQTHTNGVYFGNNIVAPGDLDGDGIGDFVVSARGYSATPGGFGDGAIIAFSAVDGHELWRAYGPGNGLGDYEVALLGDLNGDGFPDLGVGPQSIWLSCDNALDECDDGTIVPAGDDDGVPDDVEDGAPNDGDGNSDGTPDKGQSNVASFPNSNDGTYVTLESTGPTRLLDVSAIENPSPADAPVGVNFPIGFMDFQVSDLPPGSATILTILTHSGVPFSSHWKYGPTPDDPSPHWYEFAFDGRTGAIIDGNKVTLHFVDGERGDSDLLANGIVTDPGGPITGDPDIALFNPNNGQWHLRYRDGYTVSFYYGNPGDTPMMGDWDCDGTDTVAMYRESTGFIYYRNTNNFGVADGDFFFGNPGDIPIAGDWDNDGCDSFGIYRNGKVFLRNSLSTGFADKEFFFGVPGDRPFAGDFTGDGVDTIGLYRQSSGLAYFTETLPAGNVALTDNEFFYGIPSDRIIADDWDLDGDDSVGIFRPGDAKFHLSYENRIGSADVVIPFGQSTWMPTGGDLIPQSPGDVVNCEDFSTQAAAQAWYDTYSHWYGDVANLDGDANGVACEGLP